MIPVKEHISVKCLWMDAVDANEKNVDENLYFHYNSQCSLGLMS